MPTTFTQRGLAFAGALAIGGAIALSSFGTVHAGQSKRNPRPDKSFDCNSVSACLYATNSGTGYGIYATANNGVAIYATSSSGAGLSAASNSDLGVYGNSFTYRAVYGYSTNGTGGMFEDFNSTYAALYAQADYPGAYSFEALNSDNGGYFIVDAYGDGEFSGTVIASSFEQAVRTRGRERLAAYGAQSTRATIEDTGTARIMNGEGAVRFDPAFASTVDLRPGYEVFLTPDGDTRGLFVAEKTEQGFVVRETEHGRSSLTFDYRVVAHPVGASQVRLPRIATGHAVLPPLRSKR